jgi:hypothetical protein
MSIAIIGRVVVAIAVFCFGYALFKGMVIEWHRRDRELRGQAH